jgi:hypothetical protein
MELGYMGKFGRLLVGVFFLSIAALIFLLQTTTPGIAGPAGILSVFVALYISVLCALTFLLIGINKIYLKASRLVLSGRPAQVLTVMRAYYFSSVLALGPVMVIGMQSVGQVGVYEMVLVTLFLIISCIYIAKRTS